MEERRSPDGLFESDTLHILVPVFNAEINK